MAFNHAMAVRLKFLLSFEHLSHAQTQNPPRRRQAFPDHGDW